MREMKDSGIKWIGEIPQNWGLSKVKYVASIASGIAISKECYEDDGRYEIVGANGVVGYYSKWNNKRGCLTTGRVGTIGTVHKIEKAWVTDNALIVYENENIVQDYLKYVIPNFDFKEMTAGTAMPLITATKLYEQFVPMPRFYEQVQIAAYLDSKCSEIDAISADIQKEIETLEQYKRSVITEAVTKGLNPEAETKKSTIFYMAPYNSEWHLSKIGYECTKLARPFSPADMPLLCTNKGKVSPRPSDMTGKMVSEDNAMQGIHKGDIAIHGMDTWHGAIAMSEYDGKITRVVHVCDSKQDKRFIVYYLQQLAFNDVYKLISFGIRGNTSDFRSWDKVKDIYIALPDIDEQQKISDFLDLECRRVEDIVSEKKKQLDVLDAYKKSLIYEYVTGKKEVPVQN